MAKNKILLILILLCNVSFAQVFQNKNFGRMSSSRLSEFWQQMDDIFNDPNFSNANWGVLIKSLETGEYFYKRNEDKLFIPASNLKLFTTAAGLFILNSNYRFYTNIFIKGKIDGSVLKGDLVIQGAGDPTISGRFHNGNIYKVFEDWADSLITKDIDEITGNIIGDDNLFDDNGYGIGWSREHESYWYSAPTSAISFNENSIDLTIKPGLLNEAAIITSEPKINYATIINKVNTVEKDLPAKIDFFRERGTNIITVFGQIPIESEDKKMFATINNPTQYAMVVLKNILERKGIKVRGYAADIDNENLTLDYAYLKFLFSYDSPVLLDIIKAINKDSNNFYAEQLLKVIGLEEDNFGSIETGVEAIKDVLNEIGINSENMILADGSGLSRLNLVTPRQIVSLLSYIYKSEHFKDFYNSLPIAGVEGTLATRLTKSKAAKNVHAKTGYSDGVRSLSGYVLTADEEPIVFSIIVNNYIVPASLADNLQDLVCLRLANFTRK